MRPDQQERSSEDSAFALEVFCASSFWFSRLDKSSNMVSPADGNGSTVAAKSLSIACRMVGIRMFRLMIDMQPFYGKIVGFCTASW